MHGARVLVQDEAWHRKRRGVVFVGTLSYNYGKRKSCGEGFWRSEEAPASNPPSARTDGALLGGGRSREPRAAPGRAGVRGRSQTAPLQSADCRFAAGPSGHVPARTEAQRSTASSVTCPGHVPDTKLPRVSRTCSGNANISRTCPGTPGRDS